VAIAVGAGKAIDWLVAGVNAKALSTHMGHSGVSITLDRLGSLMPGNEADGTVLLDAYLKTKTTA